MRDGGEATPQCSRGVARYHVTRIPSLVGPTSTAACGAPRIGWGILGLLQSQCSAKQTVSPTTAPLTAPSAARSSQVEELVEPRRRAAKARSHVVAHSTAPPTVVTPTTSQPFGPLFASCPPVVWAGIECGVRMSGRAKRCSNCAGSTGRTVCACASGPGAVAIEKTKSQRNIPKHTRSLAHRSTWWAAHPARTGSPLMVDITHPSHTRILRTRTPIRSACTRQPSRPDRARRLASAPPR